VTDFIPLGGFPDLKLSHGGVGVVMNGERKEKER